ncbi:hypothetical protein XylorDRAFT_0020 [Xylanibacter oryzae DSM 17970]|uniref:Uncharacterized protein n=1 Tax=Xylanibacter oryzae DSM 17970 TaxID=915438 RepID=A0ABP3BC77_9BACT|nr:hypothetical protein [Xylanibacter oryzae]EXG77680.1 hypothetical protein XylorDRAFT_0020 [Xylanibacter oryzae DSM 17970]
MNDDKKTYIKMLEYNYDEASSMNFEFTEHVAIVQVQLFAKLVRCVIAEEYSEDFESHIKFTLPDGIKNVVDLVEVCKKHSLDYFFRVSTKEYGVVRYCAQHLDNLLLRLDTSIHVARMQETFQKLSDLNFLSEINTISMAIYIDYIAVNNAISGYYSLNLYGNEFDYRKRYGPNFIDLEGFKQFLGIIQDVCIQKLDEDKEDYDLCCKFIMQEYANQCNYLALWLAFFDLLTFPNLDKNEKMVLNHIFRAVRDRHSNLTIFEVVSETADLLSDSVDERGAESNTTRLKVYLEENAYCGMVARFDLPHKGEDYVHININYLTQRKDIHIRISPSTKGYDYDYSLDNLIEAIRMVNFAGIKFYHSDKEDDKRIFNRMITEDALTKFAKYIYYHKRLHGKEVCYKAYFKDARSLLRCYLNEVNPNYKYESDEKLFEDAAYAFLEEVNEDHE